MKYRFLVIGSGSIARRHMSNIRSVFPQATVACVSASGRLLQVQELPEGVTCHASIQDALQTRPNLAIVASPAPFHIEQAALLAASGLSVLIEKPLSDSLARFEAEGGEVLAQNARIVVAYNLRLLPSAAVVKQIIEKGRLGTIHSVSCDVGQYLPDWRPTSDYRRNVSAQRALGGGVLLELSHELDYLVWLFGPLANVYCLARTSGALELDVEDTVDALLVSEAGFTINLHMDFLQRAPVRMCKVVGADATLEWDILTDTVSLRDKIGASEVVYRDPGYDRNQMYVNELLHFVQVAEGQAEPFVTVAQGLQALSLVEALKRSAATGRAVALKEFS